MKKLYTLICIIGFLFAYTGTQAQVLVLEDFENPAAQDLIDFPGWTTGAPPFDLTTTDPCQGAQSISGKLEIASTAPYIQFVKYPTPPPAGVQLATGLDVEVSFQYKILDDVSDQLATADFGTLTLFWSGDGGATWTQYDVIDINDLPTLDCSTHTSLITGIPAGANFGWKMEGAFNLNYPDPNGVRVYIDDFKAIEQVTCIQPVNAGFTAGSVDFDSAEIFWEDINVTDPGQWEVIVCTSEGNPDINPFCDPPIIVNSGSPYTIDFLQDGTTYYVYIRSVCGTNDKSAWTGPIQFQTTAIGSTCNPPIEINADPNNPTQNDIVPPYVDISQTDIYGADDELAGPAGGNCGGGSVDLLDGNEVVYHYISAINDIISIDVTGLTANNVGVFVYDDCADIGTLCIGGDVTDTGGDLNVNSLQVGAGQDIYIVIASATTAGGNTAPINTDYTLTIEGFQCLTFPAPVNNLNTRPEIFFATGQTLDYYMINQGYIAPTISFADLTWYADLSDIPGNPIPENPIPNISLSDMDNYYVTQTVKNCESPPLEVIFREFNCVTDLTGIASTTPDEICESGVMTLGATGGTTPALPTPSIYWYENATGGEPIATGPTFTTPNLNVTTSYYVTEAFTGLGLLEHQANPGPVSFSESSANEGVVFTSETDMTIIDVKVYVTNGATSVALALTEAGTVVRGPKIIPVVPGTTNSPSLNTLTLNWRVDAGITYNLVKISATGGGNPTMLVDDNATFPYPLGPVGEVSGSTSGSDYYYFFDWTITGPEVLCEESPRTEVVATVHPIVPTVVSADDLLVCVGSSTILHITSADTDYVYNWTWPGGGSDTGPNITVFPTENTTYTVTAVNPITTCSFVNEITVDVYGAGSVPVDPLNVELCLGETVELSAGGENYDFETAPTGWSVINNSTAPNGDVSTAAWTVVSSPHTPSGGQLDISSNDNSQFYIASAHLLGPAASLDVELISPSLDLVGTNGASISFYHYFNFIETQETEGTVDISVNGGQWLPLKTYDGGPQHDIDIGTPNGFVLETIDISNYVGFSNVRIRFNFTGEWGWWWAIDNFTLNRNYINGTISWSPGTDLYFDEQATQPYNGSPANTVYFNGSVAGTTNYTATLDITNCGMATQDVTVTVYDTPLPTATDPQSFDLGQTIADLMVNGQNLTWYVIDSNGNFDQVSVNTPLIDGETYYVSQTLNGCESGMVSITVNFTCPAPSNLEVSTIGESPDGTTAEAIFVWTEPSGAASLQFHYYVIVTMNPGASNESIFYEGTVPSGQPFVIIEDLPFDTDYRLDLYTVCEGGPVPVNSSILNITFNTDDLAVNDSKFENLSYYPNPTAGEVFFENQMLIKEIIVYDLAGRQVFKEQVEAMKTSIDFSTLATGTYLATIEVEGSLKVVRIIKE